MSVNGGNSILYGLQGAGSQEVIDGEILHQWTVVIDFVLSFLQACGGGRGKGRGGEGREEDEEERRGKGRGGEGKERGGKGEGGKRKKHDHTE